MVTFVSVADEATGRIRCAASTSRRSRDFTAAAERCASTELTQASRPRAAKMASSSTRVGSQSPGSAR